MHWICISILFLLILDFSYSLQQPANLDPKPIEDVGDQNMTTNRQTNSSQFKNEAIGLSYEKNKTLNMSELQTDDKSQISKDAIETTPDQISASGQITETGESSVDGLENYFDKKVTENMTEEHSKISVFGNLMERVKKSGTHINYLDLSHFYNFKSLDISSTLGEIFLPKEWSDICSVKFGQYKWNISAQTKMIQLVYLHCNIRKNNTWNFLSFRNFTSNINESNFDFALDIQCTPETRISLPWPMRANLLKYISVEGCTIEDYKSQYYDNMISSIPDTIEYLRIVNSQIMVYIDDLIEQAKHPKAFTKAAHCGPVNIYMNLMKNISHKFDITKTIPSGDHYPIISKSVNFFRNLSLVKYTCNFKNLWILDRSYCMEMEAHTNIMFSHNARFPKLEILNISHTMLNEIPDILKDWRLHLPALNYLDMSYNHITEFHNLKDYGGDWENPLVGTIDLTFNNITTITAKGINHLARAKYFKVDLRNNPYNCTCEMRNFVDFMKSNKNLTAVSLTNYKYFNTITCASPVQIESRIIVKLTNEELGCELSNTVVLQRPIIALSVVMTVSLAVIVLAIRYRKEITILAFTRLNIIIPCQHGVVDGNKQYDAFISYSQHDTEWVLKTLAPRLESENNQNAFKLCLHHRDFALGAAISDNIFKSVELSRHTVLVISKNFLKSEWCLLEFRTALQQSLLEKNRHLIMILLEDIPTQEIDSDIKRCLRTLTYVKQDDRWFWDKLIYALSDKSRTKRHQKHRELQLNQVRALDRATAKGNEIKDNAIRY